jgi:hypothetical protein
MLHLDYAQRALEAFAAYATGPKEILALRIYCDGSGCVLDTQKDRIWFTFTDLKDLFESLQQEEG